MEAFALYLLKASALLAVFLLAYQALLRKETFFVANRWYLLTGLAVSITLPLITLTQVVWVEPVMQIDYGAVQHASAQQFTVAEPQTDWYFIAACIYSMGVLFCLSRLISDFIALRRLLNGQHIEKHEGFRLVDTMANVSPFSFFKTIVVNSRLYSDAELTNILAHEQVHARQAHSIDVLIARLYCIIFWCNPLVWMYKKVMLQNLEFIADSEAVKRLADIKSYQFTLLKITTHDGCVALTNQFYQSLIKKRIVMLNTNQSKKENSWKYILIIPVLAAFMLYCQSEVVAMEKQLPMGPIVMQSGIEVVVDKNTSEAQMKRDAEKLKKEHGVTLKFSKVRRNTKGEITAIKAEFKDQSGKKGITQVSGDEPIAPIRFYKNASGVGFGKGGAVRFVTRSSASSDDDEDVNFIMNLNDLDSLGSQHGSQVVVTKSQDGKGTIVTMNGEVIVDTEKILAEIGPITVDGVRVMGSEDDMAKGIVIDTKKITREAMRAAEAGMRQARIEMEKAQPAMERAQREMRENRPAMDDLKRDMEESRRDMEEAKREMEQATRELEQAKRELEAAKRNLSKK